LQDRGLARWGVGFAYLGVYGNERQFGVRMSRHDNGMRPDPSNGAHGPGHEGNGGELPIDVRPLLAHAELDAGVQLQRRVWGESYRDAVPASLLKVSQKVGGLTAGAFVESGELVGFVYGLTGVDRRGRVIHWSHMLAVEPVWRNRGVGRRLKLFQRDHLCGLGVASMYWTFDPLVARNAHLNINRLGVQLVEYVPDMYADTGSDLHAFGTDRLVAEWGVLETTYSPPTGRAVPDDAPVYNRMNGRRGEARRRGVVRIEIPDDAESMRSTSLDELRAWRESTRDAFVELMGDGFAVNGFQREAERCYYVLTRD